jgi:hypothetical protein
VRFLNETDSSRGFTLFGLSVITTCSILVYFWSLDFVNIPPDVFFVLFFTASIATSYAILSSRLGFSQKLALVLFWSLSLRLGTTLRIPTGLPDVYPDALYGRQLAVSILSTGSIPSSGLTGFAAKYVGFPMLELLLSSLSLIPRLDLDTMIRVGGGPFLFTFGLLIITLGLRRLCGESTAVTSALIGSNYMDLTTHTVHPVIGIVFFALGFYGIIRRSKSAAVIAVLSFVVLAMSHDLTPIQAAVILLTGAFLYEGVFRERSDYSFLKMGLLVSVAYGMWVSYHAQYDLRSILGDFIGAFGSLQSTVHVVHVTYSGHYVGIVGLIAFALLLGAGFVWSIMRKRDERSRVLISLGFGAGCFFGVAIPLYVLSSRVSPTGWLGSILPRLLEFVYLLAAPIAVTVIESLRNLKSRRVIKVSVRSRTIGAAILVSILLLPTFYFFVDPEFYDYTTPLEADDVRLPLHPWLTAGEWANTHLSRAGGNGTLTLTADRLPFTFVGSYGRVSLVTISQADLDGWLRWGRPHVPVLVIIDMAQHRSILNETVHDDNLVYSNSEVVFVVIEPVTNAQ